MLILQPKGLPLNVRLFDGEEIGRALKLSLEPLDFDAIFRRYYVFKRRIETLGINLADAFLDLSQEAEVKGCQNLSASACQPAYW